MQTRYGNERRFRVMDQTRDVRKKEGIGMKTSRTLAPRGGTEIFVKVMQPIVFRIDVLLEQ